MQKYKPPPAARPSIPSIKLYKFINQSKPTQQMTALIQVGKKEILRILPPSRKIILKPERHNCASNFLDEDKPTTSSIKPMITENTPPINKIEYRVPSTLPIVYSIKKQAIHIEEKITPAPVGIGIWCKLLKFGFAMKLYLLAIDLYKIYPNIDIMSADSM